MDADRRARTPKLPDREGEGLEGLLKEIQAGEHVQTRIQARNLEPGAIIAGGVLVGFGAGYLDDLDVNLEGFPLEGFRRPGFLWFNPNRGADDRDTIGALIAEHPKGSPASGDGGLPIAPERSRTMSRPCTARQRTRSSPATFGARPAALSRVSYGPTALIYTLLDKTSSRAPMFPSATRFLSAARAP